MYSDQKQDSFAKAINKSSLKKDSIAAWQKNDTIMQKGQKKGF